MSKSFLLTAALVLMLGGAAQAALIDTLDDASNFNGGFTKDGENGTSVVANGDSTVTIVRNDAGEGTDTGIDWLIGGTDWIPLTAEYDRLEVVPVGPVSTQPNSRFSVALQFQNSSGAFKGQNLWLSEGAYTTAQVLESVAAFADDAGIAGAEQYRVRFRVFPSATMDPDPGYVFDTIQAGVVPEPASLALLGLGGLMMLRRRKN